MFDIVAFSGQVESWLTTVLFKHHLHVAFPCAVRVWKNSRKHKNVITKTIQVSSSVLQCQRARYTMYINRLRCKATKLWHFLATKIQNALTECGACESIIKFKRATTLCTYMRYTKKIILYFTSSDSELWSLSCLWTFGYTEDTKGLGYFSRIFW